MAANRKSQTPERAAPRKLDHDDTAAVTAYLAALDYPLKPVVEAIRGAILGADPTISEGIKWNSASFYRDGWFATINVRASDRVQVVLHLGAAVRADATLRSTLDDPSRLLAWLSPDRAVITFTSSGDFQSKQGAFEAIIRQWASYLSTPADPG